jgi:hypothetical protein
VARAVTGPDRTGDAHAESALLTAYWKGICRRVTGPAGHPQVEGGHALEPLRKIEAGPSCSDRGGDELLHHGHEALRDGVLQVVGALLDQVEHRVG